MNLVTSRPTAVRRDRHCRRRRRRGDVGSDRVGRRRRGVRSLLVAPIQQLDVLRGHFDGGASLAEEVLFDRRGYVHAPTLFLIEIHSISLIY